MKMYLAFLIAFATPSVALATGPVPQVQAPAVAAKVAKAAPMPRVASIRNYPGVAADRAATRASAPAAVRARIVRTVIDERRPAPLREIREVSAVRQGGRLVTVGRSVETVGANGASDTHEWVQSQATIVPKTQPHPSERPGKMWQLSSASVVRSHDTPHGSTSLLTEYTFPKKAPGSSMGPKQLNRVSRASVERLRSE
jgi:hypothetical protein